MAVWRERIQVGSWFGDDEAPFVARRDGIVAALRGSRFAQVVPDVEMLVDELAETSTTVEFDMVWELIYDEADRSRVWIETVDLAEDPVR